MCCYVLYYLWVGFRDILCWASCFEMYIDIWICKCVLSSQQLLYHFSTCPFGNRFLHTEGRNGGSPLVYHVKGAYIMHYVERFCLQTQHPQCIYCRIKLLDWVDCLFQPIIPIYIWKIWDSVIVLLNESKASIKTNIFYIHNSCFLLGLSTSLDYVQRIWVSFMTIAERHS